MKIITKNWGEVDAWKIGSYLDAGGYEALGEALGKKPAQEVVEEMEKSGLQGRGGAGFPTGKKWSIAAGASSEEKYVICNLDESEPGNFKDKSIAENDPHRIIEGLVLAAYAIGANKGFIYLNGNFYEAGKILEKAIADAYEKNFLGQKITGSDFGFDLEIFYGAGAYICGEESALINSIEGKRGEPRNKPPFPCECGLFGKPTLVNNAETLANAAWIMKNGPKEFAKLGVKDSPGTKLFCIDGAVKYPGLYEAEIGASVEDLVELAGGARVGCEIGLVQVGGSSGRVLDGASLGKAPGYGKQAELAMGSGSLLVIDKHQSVKKLLQSWIDFFQRESCGKCVPCREGTFRLKGIIERLNNGNFDKNDKEDLKKLVWVLDNTTFCPLGKFSVTGLKDVMELGLVRELKYD
ncbi:MAG: NADH-ubiquinone oxidoreductase-F iron-sulfur binding region domain-containing protein [Candidatus Moranbacteria bacterium]|nr:NADH-ubiquinone oxidoreductase-F iron-sulfur binding region domain-containing protein [Candidatus Moranbacteria bacterium]